MRSPARRSLTTPTARTGRRANTTHRRSDLSFRPTCHPAQSAGPPSEDRHTTVRTHRDRQRCGESMLSRCTHHDRPPRERYATEAAAGRGNSPSGRPSDDPRGLARAHIDTVRDPLRARCQDVIGGRARLRAAGVRCRSCPGCGLHRFQVSTVHAIAAQAGDRRRPRDAHHRQTCRSHHERGPTPRASRAGPHYAATALVASFPGQLSDQTHCWLDVGGRRWTWP
jgi:hypothetical protein